MELMSWLVMLGCIELYLCIGLMNLRRSVDAIPILVLISGFIDPDASTRVPRYVYWYVRWSCRLCGVCSMELLLHM
jgi:hypothetical protein